MRAWNLAKRYAVRTAVAQLAGAMARADDETLVRLTRIGERIAPFEYQRKQLRWVRELIKQNHPGAQLARRILTELHPKVRAKVVQNLIVNNGWLGSRRRQEVETTEGFLVPYLLVISPTMRCNLRCYGCYAGAYRHEDDLPFELWDSIIEQAKELGVYFMTISGGEPFIRADELLKLAWKHNDVMFQVYTNGTFIDAEMARRLREVGNVGPCISVEGFAEETDARRGEGVHAKVLEAMHHLREEGCIFGFSATATRQTADVIATDEFFDFYLQQGCMFGWIFTYVPVGRGPDLDLMPLPEQRDKIRREVLKIRATRPMFVADFWNDGPLVGGCMAGGRLYMHVNHRGEAEPCVFVHFSVDNLHEKTLREVLSSDFFRAIQRRQPYSDNLLRPCMIIDNPEVLREVVAEGGARPTDAGAEQLLGEKAAGLDDYARRWKELADKAWEEDLYSFAKPGGLLDYRASNRERHAASAAGK
ncbi:MAG: radical SAM protein [Armatimonadetes bacterium]|nr:radical SAM protein [Armatimonadota bacterium]